MSTETVNQMVDRLTEPGPLTTERFAAQLGASLKADETNPFWRTYVFELPEGPFARGELRLHTSEPAALLILEPRDPPGLTETDIDRAALGERIGMRPDPRIPPEGTETEYFRKAGVQVAAQWRATSRRLRNLVLEWEMPASQSAPAAGTTVTAN